LLTPEVVSERLLESLGSGDRLAFLRAVRDKLALDFLGCAKRDSAPIAKQLSELDALIDSLDGVALQEGTDLDEFTKRLAAKRGTGT
jgi:hypothetical protein